MRPCEPQSWRTGGQCNVLGAPGFSRSELRDQIRMGRGGMRQDREESQDVGWVETGEWARPAYVQGYARNDCPTLLSTRTSHHKASPGLGHLPMMWSDSLHQWFAAGTTAGGALTRNALCTAEYSRIFANFANIRRIQSGISTE